MLDKPGPSLRASSALLVLSGYLALACVRGYSPLLILIPVVALLLTPWGERIHAAVPLYRTISRGITIVYFCFLPLTAVLMGAIPSLLMLIMFIQCHTLLHQKTERNYHYLYLMSFFLVLAACVQSPEPAIALVLLLMVLSAAWALSALQYETLPRIAQKHAPPEIEPINPRHRRAGDAARLRHAPIVVTVVLASVGVILLTTTFFVLTPRVEAGFLGRDNQMIRMTGFAQTVDLQGGAYVQEDPTPVMQVEFPDEPQGMFQTDLMYWRVTTLPNYANSRWSRKGLDRHYYGGVDPVFATTGSEFRKAMENPTEVARDAMPGTHRIVVQRIFSDRLPDEGVPSLDLPVKADIEGRDNGKQITWDGRQDLTIRLNRSNSSQLDYTIWSEILTPDPDLLRQTGTLYENLTPADLGMLTDHDLLPETIELARNLTAAYDNPYDKSLAILEFFNTQGFEYTLNLPALPPNNAIDAFVLEVRRGHCEFFASGMALMLRALGIPTRVVSGYRGGDWSDGAGAYIVRQSMAHLWVEVYFDGYGWVRFDPAPPSNDAPPVGMAALTQRINDFILRAKLFWFREVISFDRGVQLQRLRNAPAGIFRSLGFGRILDPQPGPQGAAGNRFFPMVTLAVLAAGAAGAWMLLRRRDQDPFKLTEDQRRATRLFEKLRTRLSESGLDVQGLAAEEIEEAVRVRGWTEFGDIQALLRDYNEVRFGRRPLDSGQLASLIARVRGLRLPAAGQGASRGA